MIPTGNQRGAALVMAMLAVALAATLSASLLWRQDAWLRQVEMQRDLAQTRLIATAGIEWARAVLAYDSRTSNIDHAGEAWAIKVPPSRVEGGEVAGELADEQAKWNLNNLIAGAGASNARELEVFRRLLRQLQLQPALASALADWLDADGDAALDGAEDAYYLGLPLPYRAANRALSDVDGLLRVRGFDAGVVERLRPHVTALPGYHRVNVNTAGAIVLAALLPDMSPSDIQELLATRNTAPFRDVSDLRSRIARPGSATGAEQLDTRSGYFLVKVRASYERAAVAGLALLERRGNEWPAVLWQKYE